jgi:hypothetical protein
VRDLPIDADTRVSCHSEQVLSVPTMKAFAGLENGCKHDDVLAARCVLLRSKSRAAGCGDGVGSQP